MGSIDFSGASTVGFGKIVFVPGNHTTPPLPDMSMIVLKSGNVYQAICIDIELDAVGDNLKEACNGLKQALRAYTSQMLSNYNGDTKAVAQDVVNAAFSRGDLKPRLFYMLILAQSKTM